MCVIICPQHPLITYYIDQYNQNYSFPLNQYLFSSVVAGFIYRELLITIALKRLYAVSKPYSFHLSVKRAHWIIGIEVIMGLIRAMILQMITFIPSGDQIGNIYLVFEILLSFFLISFAYISIASKLYQQKRKVEQMAEYPKRVNIVPNTVRHTTESLVHDTEKQEARNMHINKSLSKTERALYIKTVKMFGTITIFFANVFRGVIYTTYLFAFESNK